MDSLTSSLAEAVQTARLARGLSQNALAERSGVSRAMIVKVEQGSAQPTAVLLGRLCAALGITLSELVARAELGARRLIRAADQVIWTDPDSGYRRRVVSPAGAGLELVEIEMPPGAEVSFPAAAYASICQQIWILAGQLHLQEGDMLHELAEGDCLQLGSPASCTFANKTNEPCRYLIAVAPR
jgi:transcriptional regulator with XRE-family HTH domain